MVREKRRKEREVATELPSEDDGVKGVVRDIKENSLHSKHGQDDAKMMSTLMYGPFRWRNCPGAAGDAGICSGNGRCVLRSNGNAGRCDCFPDYRTGGDGKPSVDCSVSCKNAGLPGGACHSDYGWGKCVVNTITRQHTCQCIEGVMGDACQYVCPGLGNDLLGEKIKQKCGGRGSCHIHNVVEVPADLEQAKALVEKIAIGPGVGKFKGEYDLERLLGITLPPLCSSVCPEGLQVACDLDCIDWAEKTTVPPKDAYTLTAMKQTLAEYDHDAECSCDAGNTLGKSCHVLCPSSSGNICRGRGPELPTAAPGVKHDPWVGELIFHLGEYHASKAGCLWGLDEAAGKIDNWETEKPPNRFDRDPFYKDHFDQFNPQIRGSAQGMNGVHARMAGALRPPELLKGVVATCRCWDEIGYASQGNKYTCIIRCKGAAWAGTGENVCGGKYKFTGNEPVYGVKKLWNLPEDPKANLYPVPPVTVVEPWAVEWTPKDLSNYVNVYKQARMEVTCGKDSGEDDAYANLALVGLSSVHNYGDRIWKVKPYLNFHPESNPIPTCKVKCASPAVPVAVAGTGPESMWQDYANSVHGDMDFTCPDGQAVTGMKSQWTRGFNDRRWKFRCSKVHGGTMNETRTTEFLNENDAELDFTCDSTEVMVGFESEYSSKAPDCDPGHHYLKLLMPHGDRISCRTAGGKPSAARPSCIHPLWAMRIRTRPSTIKSSRSRKRQGALAGPASTPSMKPTALMSIPLWACVRGLVSGRVTLRHQPLTSKWVILMRFPSVNSQQGRCRRVR